MRLQNPLVSVVLAVKNGERFLAAAIDSVLAQDYRPFEIVLVDGQSTDRTREIAHSFSEVRYVRQIGSGIADGRNLGIACSQGDLIAFHSDDDLWTPDKLSVQARYMCAHPEVLYTIAHARFFLEPGCSLPPSFRQELLQGEHVAPMPETLVVRRSAFDRVGFFDCGMLDCDDVDWFARARENEIPMAVMPQVLLYKRVHDSNVSLRKDNPPNLFLALRQSIHRKRNLSRSDPGKTQ